MTRDEKIAAAKKIAELAGMKHLEASVLYGDLSEAADNASADAAAARFELAYVEATAVDD